MTDKRFFVHHVYGFEHFNEKLMSYEEAVEKAKKENPFEYQEFFIAEVKNYVKLDQPEIKATIEDFNGQVPENEE